MAGIVIRTSRRAILSCSKHRLFGSRSVSSSANKKTAINTPGWTSSEGQSEPKVRYYNSADKIGNNNSFNPGQLHFQPDGAVQSAPADPLQHILDHPSASIILRDACKCSKCKDVSTSQRDFHIAKIPVDLKPSNVKQDAQGNWVIQWQNDMLGWEDHVSVFTPQQVERLKTYMKKEHRTSTRLWNREEYTRDRFAIDYADYMGSETAFAKAIYYFARHGLLFVDNVPKEERSVERMAERIAHMKSTFYGPTWNIRSIPDAKNVAYTSKYLGFHGDLLYLKEPPTVQFLHCLENSATGGESRFVDQFKALDTLFTEDPELGNALANTRLRYEYENDGFYYTDVKPIVQWRTDSYQFPRRNIQGANNDQISHIYRAFWAPQFLGSIISDFGVSKTTLEKSLTAMNRYADILERKDLVYEEKMTPGTCVMFDNLRVLHARNEFDVNTGKRWLKGTYAEGQDLWSMEFRLKDYMAKYEEENA